MNALITRSLDGELLAPDETVRAIGKTHPLNGGRIECRVRAGLSITEILMEALADRPGMVLRRDFIVHIDGHVIEEQLWSRVRVKAGATLTFTLRPQGGNILRTVLSLVVAVAAFALAGPLGGALAGALGITSAVGISVAGALVSAGIILAGTMALNALFPTRPPEAVANEVPGSLNSIQGARNQSNPFGSLPVVLGAHRQSPFYAAKPYTQIAGDDQSLIMMFSPGYGPLAISDIKIGETPLTSFSDYELEVRQGLAGEPPITLYQASIDELTLSIKLENPNDATGADGDGGIWHSQVTAVDTDGIQADFTAAEGLYMVNASTGNFDIWTVRVSVRYRLVGTDAWTTPPDIQFTRSVSATRRGFSTSVPRGQYEVQARKHTGDGDPTKIKDTIIWTALRSGSNNSPIRFPKPLALIALRIKATDQLSGSIDTLNCLCTSLVTAWTGSAWIPNAGSQNPADLYRHVLQGPANSRPVADSQIDLGNLQAWADYCLANGFKFNQVVTSAGSVYDKLADIAAAGRAVPTWIDGKWGVIWDRPADSIVQHFTPRNSWGFQGQRTYAQQPHGWRVSFINEDNGYTSDERIVYDDGWDATSATLFEGIQFPGVTDPDLVWKHGRYHIAQSRLRPEKVSLNVGWEHLVCTRGDRVRVTHDVLLIGLASGRVKSVAGQVVTFDEVVTIDAGKTYGFQFRVPEDARCVDRPVDPNGLEPGEYTSLTLTGDLGLIKRGTLFGFGETEQESAVYRVQGITHQKDLIATLTLVDDAPEISQADQGEIPAYNPHVSVPADPFTLPPRALQYLEVIDGQGASVRALVRLTWQVPRFGKIASFQVQQRDDNAAGDWTTVDSVVPPRTSVDVALLSAGTWSFRVRCLFNDGTVSDWATLDHIALLGLSRAPAPVGNLRNTYITGRSHLAWDSPIDPRTVNVEIRKGESFAAAQVVSDAASSPWQTVGDDTYWVTTYVNSPFGERIYGSPEQSIEIVNSVNIENIIVRHDERAEGWDGYFSGSVGKDTDQNFLRTSGGDPFLARADFLGTSSFLDGGGLQTGGYYWSKHVVNAGGLAFCRVSNDWTATGVPVDDDFLGNPDFLGVPDYLKSYLSQYIRVRPVIRISKSGPGSAFDEVNLFEPDNAFLAGATWESIKVWSPDVYEGWLFQMGMQFEILTDVLPDPRAIAYLLSWVWTIDVPDRLDSYQNLTVPVGGLPIVFRPTGAGTDKPFNGGLNNEPLPHITPSIRNPSPGNVVTWKDLSLSGVTLQVVNAAGVDVGDDEVNALVRGY